DGPLRRFVDLLRREQHDRVRGHGPAGGHGQADGRGGDVVRDVDDDEHVMFPEGEMERLEGPTNVGQKLADGVSPSGSALRHEASQAFLRIGRLDQVPGHLVSFRRPSVRMAMVYPKRGSERKRAADASPSRTCISSIMAELIAERPRAGTT